MDDLQVTVLNANRMEFRESFPKHLHSFYELHYIFAGSGTLLCQGERYPLSAGTLYLNGRNSSHEQLTNPDDPMMEYCVALDIKSLYYASLPRNKITKKFWKLRKNKYRAISQFFGCELLL